MSDTKMLQIIIDGQKEIRQEISGVKKEMRKGFAGVNKRVDKIGKLETQIASV